MSVQSIFQGIKLSNTSRSVRLLYLMKSAWKKIVVPPVHTRMPQMLLASIHLRHNIILLLVGPTIRHVFMQSIKSRLIYCATILTHDEVYLTSRQDRSSASNRCAGYSDHNEFVNPRIIQDKDQIIRSNKMTEEEINLNLQVLTNWINSQASLRIVIDLLNTQQG